MFSADCDKTVHQSACVCVSVLGGEGFRKSDAVCQCPYCICGDRIKEAMGQQHRKSKPQQLRTKVWIKGK